MRYDGEGSSSHGVSRPFLNGSGTLHHKPSHSTSTNGHQSAIANGSSVTNGHAQSKPRFNSYFGHDREEVSRLLIQALTDLGYHGSAAMMSQESGYDLENPTVAAFRNAILTGDWHEAEVRLFGESPGDGDATLSRGGLALNDDANPTWMRFWLREQKFLELLEIRDTGRALMVLRTELTPLSQHTAKLHALSSLLMCQSAEHVKSKAGWDGAHGESRQRLLSALSKYIKPSVMLPEYRLAVLLHQVKQQQIASCIYHNSAKSPSLYQDHTCSRDDFPMHVVHEFKDGQSEFWVCAFSHDGTKIATGGVDGILWVYDVHSRKRLHTLPTHEDGIVAIAWSPTDSHILTCSQDRKTRLYEAQEGRKVGALPTFGQPCSSCAWAPDGQSFVVGCLEKSRNLCQYDINGSVIYDWDRPHRIQDLVISPDGCYLVAMSSEKKVYVYNFNTREMEHEVSFDTRLCSVDVSSDSKRILVKKNDGEIRLIDVESGEVIKEYGSAGKPSSMVIRANFGGANQSFVVTGSETGSIYIYHKETGLIVERLDGHKSSCNAVTWNPADSSMFASCGDDGVLKLWSSLERSSSYKESARPDSSDRDSNRY